MIFYLLFFGSSLVRAGQVTVPVVAIQPLGSVAKAVVDETITGIQSLYAVEIVILPEKPLPKNAFYKPRARYKAEDITDELGKETPTKFTKVVALTASDISVTRDDGSDWGVIGIGQLGGRACVVSTYRLGKGKVADAIFNTRLQKVVNHELGHTFGVDHCPVAGCLMQDKRGKVATVDAESGQPCATCAKRLPLARPGR